MTIFPEHRWGDVNGRLRRPALALASSAMGSSLIRMLTPLDRKLLIRTRGKYTLLGPIGAPTMLLTSVGRKSGLPRTSPLLYSRAAPDRLVVFASNFGQAHHPAWSANLLADPNATVSIVGEEIPVTASRLHGEAAERAFKQMIDEIPAYGAYRGRTTRDIRVFELVPR